MAKKVCLMSGHSSTGSLEKIDKKALKETNNKNVLILNLSWDDPSKLAKKEKFFSWYFNKLGAKTVEFLSGNDTYACAEESFGKAGLLYLPGGNTETLINNIEKKELTSLISSFNGVISGNSSGAEVLCPEYLNLKDKSVKIAPTLGVMDFWVKVHYNPRDEFVESTLSILSKERKIYALQNPAAVIWTPGEGEKFIGNVYRFSRGKRKRVN